MSSSEPSLSAFLELLKQETKMSIILILRTYGSLNLKQIAKVMGISPPSCLPHLKKLIEEGYIELDQQMADKRGKYYRITDKLDIILKNGEKQFEQGLKNKDSSFFTTIGAILRTVAIITQRFGLYAAHYIEENAKVLAEKLQDEKSSSKMPKMFLSGNLTFVNAASEKELMEIQEAFTAFTSKINELGKKNSDLDTNEIFQRIMISNLVMPLLSFDPRKETVFNQ